MPASKSASAENIPLRLRRRRDGSLALTDVEGRVNGERRVFPANHVFTPSKSIDLASAGALEMSGVIVTVRLCNATAVYRVTERRANGEIVVEIESAKVTDTPPVDAKAAAKLAALREES